MSKLEDKEIMKMVLEALGINANALSVKLGYKSHQSVYFILNGTNSLSLGMRTRILKHFPNVNANFLSDGILPVILSGADLQAQMNLLGVKGEGGNAMLDMQKFANIPSQLERIESKLDQLLSLNDID